MPKKFSNIQRNLVQKYKAGAIVHLGFKNVLQSYRTWTIQYGYKNRHRDQWSRIKNPQINSHIFNQLIFNKNVNKRQWENNNHFNNLCWQNWISTCKTTKLNPHLKPRTKVNLKIKHNTWHYKTLRRNIKENPHDIRLVII